MPVLRATAIADSFNLTDSSLLSASSSEMSPSNTTATTTTTVNGAGADFI
jgi:hypothetical protein